MTEPKPPDDLIEQIKSTVDVSPDPPPTTGDPTGLPMQHGLRKPVPPGDPAGDEAALLVNLAVAIRVNDAPAIEDTRRRLDFHSVQADFLKLLIVEYDKRLPDAERGVGAADKVLLLEEQLAMIKRIDPSDLSEAIELPAEIRRREAELVAERQRATAGFVAARELLGISEFAPDVFPDPVNCDPTKRTPGTPYACHYPHTPAVIIQRLHEIGLPVTSDGWRKYQPPTLQPKRKRRRLIASK